MQMKNKPSPKTPVQITLAQVLFFLNAAVWLFFLILFLSDQVSPGDSISTWVIPILMVGNILAMLVCGIGLGKRKRRMYYLSLAVILVNIILTVTDQVGLFDYLTLLLDLVILTLLIASYKAFSHPSRTQPQPE
jgi:MFS family permease